MSRASDRVGSSAVDSRVSEHRRSSNHQSHSHSHSHQTKGQSSPSPASAASNSGLLKAGADFRTTPREEDDQHYGTSPGDTLNTVGSASSHSSAASSVFSNHLSAYSTSDSRYNMNTLTPLTQSESSPPGKPPSPRSQKRTYADMQNGTSKSPYLAPDSTSRAVPETITPVQTPPEPHSQALPGPGKVTCIKRVYDPINDKSLKTEKEKRQATPTYRTITNEVRSTSMQVLLPI